MDAEEFLKKDYPGRGVIIGSFEATNLYCVYFVMGRSPSSQARLLKRDENLVFTEPTDLSVLQQGNPELLLYNAIACLPSEGLYAVSNGRQTDTIFTEFICKSQGLNLYKLDSKKIFTDSLNQWNYEPDPPSTPRIAGCIAEDNYLGIIKKGKKGVVREVFKVKDDTLAGITTYSGENRNPLPSYDGKPFTLNSVEDFIGYPYNAKDLGSYVWELLNPDFRVSLAALFANPFKHKLDFFIINRNEADL
jgi:IMP cyclohydrolase